MKYLLALLIFIKVTPSLGQIKQNLDSIPLPKYDTIDGKIVSKNSFYFGTTLYKIPKDCKDSDDDEPNCCSFSLMISKVHPNLQSYSLGCFDGTTLNWTKQSSEIEGKQNFESNLVDLEKQMKSSKKEKITFQVCGKQVTAYKQICINHQDYKFTKYSFFGLVNGEFLYGSLYVNENTTSSKNLNLLFQRLVKF